MFGQQHDDQPERPRGKRHQPRDMTNETGNNPNPTTQATTKANNDRYAQQREQMQEGQSFLDQMYKSERPGRSSNAGITGGAGKRRASGQQDHLNVFAWDSPTAAAQQHQKASPVSRGGAAAQPASSSAGAKAPSATPAVTAANQRRRDVEAQKFEMNNEGGFLRFSEDAKRTPAQQGKAAQPASAPTAPYGSPEHGMMDALMRDDPKTKNRSAAAEHSSKRHVQQPKTSDGPDFAGFPGMGARSQDKQFQHIRRKDVQSNVFLPQPVAGLEDDMNSGAGGGVQYAPARQPAPPSAPRGEDADEDEDFDAIMAAIDPSQLTDDELQEYVAYLRHRQAMQGDDAEQADGRGGREQRGAPPSSSSSQAQRIMLYQQRQRGE